MKIILISLIIWNFIVLLLYGYDKLRAIKSKSRVSEFMLVSCALICGGMGAVLGMIIFNHKTKKPKFRFFIPLSLFIWLYLFYYLI